MKLRLATAQAQLASTQGQAAKARALAEAASKKYGWGTLEDRAAFAKLAFSQIEIAKQDSDAAGKRALSDNKGLAPAIIDLICRHDKIAAMVDCPAQYRARRQEPPKEPEDSGPVVASTSPPNAQTNAPPPSFDCSKATLGVDFVICANPPLMEAEKRLEEANRAARASKGDEVKLSQRAWVKSYGPNCGLPAKGQPTSAQSLRARDCVLNAIKKRTTELNNAGL